MKLAKLVAKVYQSWVGHHDGIGMNPLPAIGVQAQSLTVKRFPDPFVFVKFCKISYLILWVEVSYGLLYR